MKCSGLTMQSADITLASIGNRHRHACTDALLEKYTLAQFLFLSFFVFFLIAEEEQVISDAHFPAIAVLWCC